MSELRGPWICLFSECSRNPCFRKPRLRNPWLWNLSLSRGESQCGFSLPSESLHRRNPCFRNPCFRNCGRIQAPLNQTRHPLNSPPTSGCFIIVFLLFFGKPGAKKSKTESKSTIFQLFWPFLTPFWIFWGVFSWCLRVASYSCVFVVVAP